MNQEQLKPYFPINFTCDDCQREFQQAAAYSVAPSLERLKYYHTYCANCVEITQEETCSFREVEAKTNQYMLCDKPLFDKKKQLCRSHHYQVRKRFNEANQKKNLTSNEPLNSKEGLKNIPPEKKKQKNWGAAPLHETTKNIQSLNIDKRTLKKTGRIHLFATRVKKEWIEQLKAIAYEERLHYNELLEKALECYEKQQKKLWFSKRSTGKPTKQNN